MSFLYRYLLIFLACGALLIGIQAPNFVDQFEKRLNAHLIEVQNNLRGYQQIADRSFSGSMEALIQKHEVSSDTVFRAEAVPMRNLYQRAIHLQSQQAGINADFPKKIKFILLYGDRELLRETWHGYSAAIPLNSLAVYCGFATAGVVLMLTEIMALLISGAFPRHRSQRALLRDYS